MNFTITNIWNVIAKVPGQEEPDRAVIIGNHRDAWVYGASDPHSGTSIMLEVARGIGRCLHTGWKPRRSIIFSSFDGEEYGLLGSVEFVERHARLLSAQAVAYFNVDFGVKGTAKFLAKGTPNLQNFLKEITALVPLPETQQRKQTNTFGFPNTNLNRNRNRNTNMDRNANGNENENENGNSGGNGNENERESENENRNVNENSKNWAVERAHGRAVADIWPQQKLEPLGATSDFMPFLQELGVACLDVRFVNEQPLVGVYHSIYDTPYWLENFVDSSYTYHVTLAKVLGLALIRMADAQLLPFHYQPYALLLSEVVSHIEAKLPSAPDDVHQAFNVFKEAVQHFSSAVDELERQIQAVEPRHLHPETHDLQVREINDRLMLAERAFIEPGGTLGRALLKHVIFAPDLNDSGSGELVPSIQRPMKEGNWEEAHFQLLRVSQIIDAVSEILVGGFHSPTNSQNNNK